MKKVIIAVLILVLAFLVYSFAPTGYSVMSQETVIKISPKEVRQGQTINVDLRPAPQGVNILMSLHPLGGGARKDTTDAWGHDCTRSTRSSGGFKCRHNWNFNYKLPATMKTGPYYLQFFDYQKNEFIRSELFTVVR